jgi:hypothetical protein
MIGYILAAGLGSVITLVVVSTMDGIGRRKLLDYFDLQSNHRDPKDKR